MHYKDSGYKSRFLCILGLVSTGQYTIVHNRDSGYRTRCLCMASLVAIVSGRFERAVAIERDGVFIAGSGYTVKEAIV